MIVQVTDINLFFEMMNVQAAFEWMILVWECVYGE